MSMSGEAHRPTSLSAVDAKIETAILEIREIRSVLDEATREHERGDHRLKRIEKVAENIGTVNDIVLDTVRSFEAMISIDLVRKINALIEERLTVVSELEARRSGERWRLRISMTAAILLAFALVVEIHSGSIGGALVRIWGIVVPASATLGEWIERVAG